MKRKVIHPMGPQNTQSQPYLVPKLVHETTGIEAKPGDILQTFRNEVCELESIELPRHGGSTGRIYVKMDGHTQSFFPGVCSLKWVGRTDQD
jgi:hypothetical protein